MAGFSNGVEKTKVFVSLVYHPTPNRTGSLLPLRGTGTGWRCGPSATGLLGFGDETAEVELNLANTATNQLQWTGPAFLLRFNWVEVRTIRYVSSPVKFNSNKSISANSVKNIPRSWFAANLLPFNPDSQ